MAKRTKLYENGPKQAEEANFLLVRMGQALGYMLGALRIRALRDAAQRQLGDRFDIRAFHDQILGQGAQPLDLLERRMTEWMSGQRTRD